MNDAEKMGPEAQYVHLELSSTCKIYILLIVFYTCREPNFGNPGGSRRVGDRVSDSSVSESHSALVPVFVDREASAADGRADESRWCERERFSTPTQHIFPRSSTHTHTLITPLPRIISLGF